MNPILGINFLQIVYHLFNFAILGLGLYLLLYKPVVKFMDKRTAYYEDLDKKSKDSLQKAKDLEDQKKQALKDLEEKKSSLKEEARTAAMKEADSIILRAREEEKNIIDKAKKSGEFEKEKLIKEGKEQVKDLLIQAVEKSANNDKDPFDAFIEAAGKEE